MFTILIILNKPFCKIIYIMLNSIYNKKVENHLHLKIF